MGNKQWKRLLRIALAPATITTVRNRYPDMKDESVTYHQIITHLKQQFGGLKSEYASMNTLLDTTQKPGEAFSAFHDRLSSLASRSGFPCVQCKDHLVRHLALRGTSCPTIRAAALQNKWTSEELPVRAREIEISTAASGPTRKIATLGLDMEEDQHYQRETDINRLAGPYSKARRSQNNWRANRLEEKTSNHLSDHPCSWCGRNQKHDRSRCPASRAPCNKCGKLGHFAVVSRSRVDRPAEVPLATGFKWSVCRTHICPVSGQKSLYVCP